MNKIARGPQLDYADVRQVIEARDAQVANKYGKDAQLMLITNARQYRGDRITRAVKPHRLLDPAHGPLIAYALGENKANLLKFLRGGMIGHVPGGNMRQPT